MLLTYKRLYGLIVTCIFSLHITCYAQINLDSLSQLWNDASQHDTIRLKAIERIAWDGYLFSKPDTAFDISQIQYDSAVLWHQTIFSANALNTQGASYFLKSDYKNALVYYEKCLKIREEIKDKKGIAACVSNIGLIHAAHGEYGKAIKYYIRSLVINEEFKNKKGIASAFNNIGMAYENLEEYDKAIDQFEKSIQNFEDIEDLSGLSRPINNIGLVYQDLENHDKAIEYFEKSLAIGKKLDSKNAISYSTLNLAISFKAKGEIEKALEYFNTGLALKKEIGNKRGIVIALAGLGDVYSSQGDHKKAIQYNEEALNIALEIEELFHTKSAANALYKLYKKVGITHKALEMFELYTALKDSIESIDNQKEVLKQEFKYAYDKKRLADSIAHKKEQELNQLELEKKEAKIKAKTNLQYALFGGIGLVIIFSIFIYNRYRITQKQKEIISEAHRKLGIQRDQIGQQKLDLEVKNNEITASITYAKRIQEALLTNDENIHQMFEHFVFFKPKDIVSGDFYWFLKKQGYLYLAVADCTGHGVPGAFLTMLGTSFLNEINSSPTLLSPSQILDILRDKVVKELSQTGKDFESKDGMDISLIRIDQTTYEAEWAGAMNHLYILKKNSNTIEIMKGDREPIGYTKSPSKFTNHPLKLEKGDLIYLFSDGYVDQFGGKENKKFGYQRFRNHLLTNKSLSMKEQGNSLTASFENWMKEGNEDQLDDVCVLGLKI